MDYSGGIHIITLGCPKNEVDSRSLAKGLLRAGLLLSDSPEEADCIIINTCGFINDAKRESIEEILRIGSLKREDALLIVMGCLVKRYEEELRKALPEVDAFFGINEEEKITGYLIDHLRWQSNSYPRGNCATFRLPSYGYIKISDGCNRHCSFCVIPSIKGPYKSIDPEEIIKEAEELLHLGTKELILVGQDITSYGIDKKGLPSLRELVREITSLKGDFWLRLLYLHPEGIRDDLIEEIAENPKICKYMDIPLQHSEKRILQLMRRPGSKEDYRRLLKRIREAIPDVTIRTTFIVGFPQEREEDFLALKDFVKEMEFDRLGVFKYSREEGSPAYSLKGQIPEKTKRRRFNELMKLQAEISLKKNLALVGKRFRVLIDEVERSIGGEVKVAFGRLQSQAPEIDGVVIIHTRDKIEPGLFKEVVITKAYEYDLEAKLAE